MGAERPLFNYKRKQGSDDLLSREKALPGMIDFLFGTHEFLGNHSFLEFLVGYIFGAALIIGAPTVFLLLAFTSALMKTNGKMGGYREYEDYGQSSLNNCPPFILPDPTASKSS